MSDKPENPRAFPAIIDEKNVLQWGMTLRDYFAAAALQGLLSNPNIVKFSDMAAGVTDPHGETIAWTRNECSLIAEDAYEQADSMLKVRES